MGDGQQVAVQNMAAREQLHLFLTRWFQDPDLDAVDIVLAAARAHFFKQTKPVWLWLVGASGAGKTEAGIRVLEGLSGAKLIGDLSTKAFLTHKKGQSGILQRLDGGCGILLFPDFTSLLSKRADDRTEIAGQLRMIADGAWVKDTGERSQTLWRGKVSCFAASTPALERYWSLYKNMGERFFILRWKRPGGPELSERLESHDGHETEIEVTLRSLGKQVIGNPADLPEPTISKTLLRAAGAVVEWVCHARTHVYRDRSGGPIEDVETQEVHTRLLRTVVAIAKGNASLEGREVVEKRDIQFSLRVAYDSVPHLRWKVLCSMTEGAEMSLVEVSKSASHFRAAVKRELEELEALQIVETRRESGKDGNTWFSLSESFCQRRFGAASLLESA